MIKSCVGCIKSDKAFNDKKHGNLNQDPVAIQLGHPAHSLSLLSSTLPTQSSHHAFSKRAAMFLILLGDPGAPPAPPSEEEKEALSDFFLPGVAPLLTTPL